MRMQSIGVLKYKFVSDVVSLLMGIKRFNTEKQAFPYEMNCKTSI